MSQSSQPTEPTTRGSVSFVGAGPGAADLLTFRAAKRIADADIVIWASSLVTDEVLEHAREDAEIVDSAAIALEGVLAIYQRAADEGLRVARVHSGEAAVALAEGGADSIDDDGISHGTKLEHVLILGNATAISCWPTLPKQTESM